MQGHAGGVKAKLRQDLQPTLLANWKVWVPFQLLNFRFVPPSLQACAPARGRRVAARQLIPCLACLTSVPVHAWEAG